MAAQDPVLRDEVDELRMQFVIQSNYFTNVMTELGRTAILQPLLQLLVLATGGAASRWRISK
ncbi:MAG: hypothetical protein GY739_05450 [Mesoflavibacter sp.]|nr:hypothetical protein [Mesoflavibacter sp.]